MKSVSLIAVLAFCAAPALAERSGDAVEPCLSGGGAFCTEPNLLIAPDLSPITPSPADINLRNPNAPQSNYTSRLIEDDDVFAAQVVLQKNGCYDGRLDGVLADGTVFGIKLFQANMGLRVTGELTDETAETLRQSHNRYDICR